MSAPGSDESARRARLRGLKLRTLVQDHLGRAVRGELAPFTPGAALVEDGATWVLLEEDAARGLGPALAWFIRNGADQLNVLAEHATGLLARRAGAFAAPIAVWHVDQRAVAPADVEPLPPPAPAAPAHLAFIPTIEAAGASPVVEHGVVGGEVRGLEVCRVVDDEITGEARLDVGVSTHDRQAFALLHGAAPSVEALEAVVASVSEHRGAGGEHPLDRLVPERLLRWRLQDAPGSIGLTSLEPAEPPVPRGPLMARMPCTATGRRPDGTSVVVVCSVGVDLDVVPYASDARLHAGDHVPTMIVAPTRDLVPITRELAGLLDRAVELVPFSG